MGVTRYRTELTTGPELMGGTVFRPKKFAKGTFPITRQPWEPGISEEGREGNVLRERSTALDNLQGASNQQVMSFLKSQHDLSNKDFSEPGKIGSAKTSEYGLPKSEPALYLRDMGPSNETRRMQNMLKSSKLLEQRKGERTTDLNQRRALLGLSAVDKTPRQIKWDREKAQDYEKKLASGKKLNSKQKTWLDSYKKAEKATQKISQKSTNLKQKSAKTNPVNATKEGKRKQATQMTPSKKPTNLKEWTQHYKNYGMTPAQAKIAAKQALSGPSTPKKRKRKKSK